MKFTSENEILASAITNQLLDPAVNRAYEESCDLIKRVKEAVWSACPFLAIDSNPEVVQNVVRQLLDLQNS